jgi:hypothetical protein
MQEGGRTSGIHASTAAVPGQGSESKSSLFAWWPRWSPSTTRLVPNDAGVFRYRGGA